MTTTKQFRALCKFHLAVNPFFFLSILAVGGPFYFVYFGAGPALKDFVPDLDLYLSNANLFLIGIMGILSLAPEIMQATWSGGPEFLLTRAVDRKLVMRSRALLFIGLVLVTPIGLTLVAQFHPDLVVGEFHKASHQLIIDSFPGCTIAPADRYGVTANVTIPNGYILLGLWRLCQFAVMAGAIEVLIFVIYPLKHRRFIALAVYMGVIFAPLVSIFGRSGSRDDVSTTETLFLWFAHHTLLVTMLCAIALVLAQLWCERRFAQIEQ